MSDPRKDESKIPEGLDDAYDPARPAYRQIHDINLGRTRLSWASTESTKRKCYKPMKSSS